MIDQTGEIITSKNLKVHPRLKELYKFFKFNGKLVDIENPDSKNLGVFSRDVLKMINNGEAGWEEMLPEGIANLIKEKKLFDYGKTRSLEAKK